MNDKLLQKNPHTDRKIRMGIKALNTLLLCLL